MTTRSLAARSPFAHLLNRGKNAAKAEDTSEEDDMKKSKKAEDSGDTTDPEDNEDDKKENVDETKDEKEDEDDISESDNAKKGKAKKAKALDEEDSDGDDEKDPKASAARRRERSRCAAIFASPAAATRPDIAAHLAFGTNLSRVDAINTLAAVANGERDQTPEPKGSSLRERMASTNIPDVGSDRERKPESGPSAFAAEMARINKIRHGQS